MSSRWNQSEKRCDKSSETVPIAEYNILKDKYERVVIENESLIQTLELLEKTHGLTVDDIVEKQGRALERNEEIAKLANKYGEIQKKLETVEKDLEFIMSVDDDITEMKGGGEASGSARPAKKPKVETNEDVIMLLSDDEGGNQRESNGRQSNSSHQDPFIYV
ncbi:PREDICTED: uncharacterized protein LOC104722629 [Camelina sativa]|uniref:Uncharacterized protein LOC104722629 n=1 Tax=Camelina sativa TaxID=90675 RepID=A0ABM0UCH6_CAMSA|nr:PREDICTED: uncharacterized protein LOC104722629 [Camelina sativa]